MTTARRIAAAAAVALAVPPTPPAVADLGPQWGAPVLGAVEVIRPFHRPATTYGRGHRGTDLAAEPGAAVVAAGRGRVAFTGQVAGRGVVVVTHADGLRTTYEPVRALVRAGEEVGAGATLGTLAGPAHCPTPRSCLHWGLRTGDPGPRGYRDPMSLLDGRRDTRVRLLPLRPGPPPVSCAG